jgi:hypothetical protein
MKKIFVVIFASVLCSNVAAQQYSGLFASADPQGMHTDTWFNLVPNSGTTSVNSWNIYHKDGGSIFQVQFGAPQPLVFLGASRATDLGINGNVGIGTTVPTTWFPGRVLEIADVRPILKLNSTNPSGISTITFTNSSVNTTSHVGEFHLNYLFNQTSNDKSIISWGGYPAGSIFTLQADGNVGMGTTSPTQRLEVAGSMLQNADNAAFGIDAQANARFGFIKKFGSYTVMASDNASPIIFSQTNQTGIYTNIPGATLTERMRIDVNGNVGIGTAAPNVKFQIAGSGGANVDLQVNGRIHSGDASNAGGMWVNGTGTMFVGQTNITSLGLYNNGEWRLIADASGNVGIGTNTPDQKLTVKGIIHTQEVRVDMSVPGPDYVFEKDYDLLSLTELETYIHQNKHLPEVPSAKEMEKDGLNLKEMNLILLKKVEELTLHLIETNKRYQEQQKVNLVQQQLLEKVVNEINQLKNK